MPAQSKDHSYFMDIAIEQAKIAESMGEVPIGAIIADVKGNIIAKSHNLVKTNQDPTAHAEMLAMATARQANNDMYLEDCTLYVTLEPCAMCAQAISWSRVGKVVFGAYDVKSGGTENGARIFNHSHYKPEVLGGIREQECTDLIQTFFKEKR